MSDSRVLVIDDDDDIRGLVVTLLERAGVTVRDAPNGREGLREFHSWRPDLVVLDVSMPELDGWNVLDRIRDMSAVPVLMLTARGDELERVRGLQAGADDYVVKPFGKQELVARVQALLRRAAQGTPTRSKSAMPTRTSRSTGASAACMSASVRSSSRRSSSGCSRPSSATRARCSAATSCSSSSGATPTASAATR